MKQLLLIFVVLMVGCTELKTELKKKHVTNKRFIPVRHFLIEEEDGFTIKAHIIKDTLTGVEYIMLRSGHGIAICKLEE